MSVLINVESRAEKRRGDGGSLVRCGGVARAHGPLPRSLAKYRPSGSISPCPWRSMRRRSFCRSCGLWPVSGVRVHNAGSVPVVLHAAPLDGRRFDDGEQATGEALPATGGWCGFADGGQPFFSVLTVVCRE